MKRFTKSASCLLLGMFVTCMLGERAQAQFDGVGLMSDPSGGQIVLDRAVVQSSGNGLSRIPFGPRVRVYSQFGNGFGWEDGQTFANIFYPLHINPGTDLFFVDVRGFATYNSVGEKSGGNVGLGYRRLFAGSNTIIGVSAWGDADGGQVQNFFQAGASAELIVNGFEMRANGYLAEGDGAKRVIGDTVIPSPYFRNNQILVNRVNITDQQFDGFDGEVGGLIPFLEAIQVYGYVGGYYMHSDDNGDFAGAKARWEMYLHEDIQFGMEYRRDDRFGSSTWGNVMVQLPNGPLRAWWRRLLQPRGVNQQLARQVERHYRIPVERISRNTPTPLIDPATGDPYFVFHVDPNATSANGTPGSFGNPFRTLQAALTANNSNVNIIRVVAASNLTTPNGPLAINGPIQLLENQHLLSSAVNHTLTSQFGSFTLPGFNAGPLPLLNNTSAMPGSVIELVGNNTAVAGFVIDGSDFNGNIVHDGITNTPGIVDFNINQNTFQNAIRGIDLAQVGGTGIIDRNNISGMTSSAIEILNNNTSLNLAVTDNTNSNNGGPGFNIDQIGGSLNLNVIGNVFDMNLGAGVGVALRNAAAGTFQIRDNVITRTQDDLILLNGLQGEGVNIRLVGDVLLPNATATLTNSTIGNNIIGDLNDPTLGNVSHGIFVTAQEDTLVQHLLIEDNITANNGLNGIQFARRDNAHVNDVQLLRNNVAFNGTSGILLLSQNAPNDIADFLVQQNQVVSNGLNGILLAVAADGNLQADLDRNFIDSNAAHGILATEVVNAATDQRDITGTWTKNVISNNGLNGINLSSAMSLLTVGLDGIDPVDNLSRGNLITQNGLAGILINGPGTGTFTNNVITLNGIALGNVHEGAGIDVQGVGFKDLTFTNNSIRNNFGDGFEFRNQGNLGSFFITATGNSIDFNLGRGVDILNQDDADSTLIFRSNIIASNDHEGFYVVNTSSITQQQNAPAFAGLAADGLTDRAPFLTLVLEDNRISQNGAASLFPATGLVVRVGTSQFGFVSAQVNNNTMLGNFGDDVYFESFTSTVNPAAMVADPLSVVFLQFTGNTGDSLDVVNFGAFYNNADAGKSPNPPFTQGTARPRNAQRDIGAFPGLGTSTFIVEASGGLDPANTLGNNFTTFDGFTSAVLLLNSGPGGTATTFTWELVPVGTLFP